MQLPRKSICCTLIPNSATFYKYMDDSSCKVYVHAFPMRKHLRSVSTNVTILYSLAWLPKGQVSLNMQKLTHMSTIHVFTNWFAKNVSSSSYRYSVNHVYISWRNANELTLVNMFQPKTTAAISHRRVQSGPRQLFTPKKFIQAKPSDYQKRVRDWGDTGHALIFSSAWQCQQRYFRGAGVRHPSSSLSSVHSSVKRVSSTPSSKLMPHFVVS